MCPQAQQCLSHSSSKKIHQISKVHICSSPFSSIYCSSERVSSFLNDCFLGDGEVGILPLNHRVPQGFHHMQLSGKGDQRSALHLSLQMKEVHRLWAKCERMKWRKNTDLQLDLREKGVAATILHNLDTRSHTPLNPSNTCNLKTLPWWGTAKMTNPF